MEADNFENNLHHTANNIEIGDLGLLSSCLYINVNNIQEYPTMKLVLAISNDKNRSNNDKINSLILTYQNYGRITPLNNWDNQKYFTACFPTFILFKIGNHLSTTNGLKKRKNAIRSIR